MLLQRRNDIQSIPFSRTEILLRLRIQLPYTIVINTLATIWIQRHCILLQKISADGTDNILSMYVFMFLWYGIFGRDGVQIRVGRHVGEQ